MNPRHAAVAALAGWYLMVPMPSRGYDPMTSDSASQTSFSQWEQMGSYDTADECDTGKAKLIKEELQAPASKDDGDWIDAKCIASDDPRLKSN